MRTRRKTRRMIGPLVGLAALGCAGAALAAPPVFEVVVEIKAPSGEDLGRRRITTPLDIEATLEAADGQAPMKLSVLVRRAPEPTCQQITLRLERREAGEAGKETSVRAVACGDWPVRFEGSDLGAPAMTITVKKIVP
jgi:hypothetical protein